MDEEQRPQYWRSPRTGNAGVLYHSRMEAVQNCEQMCEPLYTADQLKAAVLAERERIAAQFKYGVAAAIRAGAEGERG